MLTVEDNVSGAIGFSGLLATMALSATIKSKNSLLAKNLSAKFSKLWIPAEILLFVLVGASVNISYAGSAALPSVLVIFSVLIFRVLGVFLCLIGSKLTKKERVFVAFSYLPKATVQAAIGGIPLAIGLACGNTILTVSVLSILITAPLGAFLMDISYKKFLTRSPKDEP